MGSVFARATALDTPPGRLPQAGWRSAASLYSRTRTRPRTNAHAAGTPTDAGADSARAIAPATLAAATAFRMGELGADKETATTGDRGEQGHRAENLREL
ncbi:MAG: hypothetical protein ACRD3W_29995 [Terriglobales bacterium]